MEPFKNFFSRQLVLQTGAQLQDRIDGFDQKTFVLPVMAQLESLELSQRAQLIADHVHLALPKAPAKRAKILLAMVKPSQSGNIAGLTAWAVHPLTLVIGQHGVGDFDRSMQLLKKLTSIFTCEFGIRYFLLADQERALKIMYGWVNDADYHVRRLISEGSRPRLPWAMQLPQLIADPNPVLDLLTSLRDDEQETVRRSVANHLNDIAKDHPGLVAKIAKSWMKNASEQRQKLLRHGCRTLIKQGHAQTLRVFGYLPPEIKLDKLLIRTKQVRLGEALQFECDIRSLTTKSQSLVIDYLVHFRKANGKTAAKVFKWKKVGLPAGGLLVAERSHPIRPITTRRYYSGAHAVTLRINGRDFGFEAFELHV